MPEAPQSARALFGADMLALSRHGAIGLGVGAAAGIALCLIVGLYPWFSNDAEALGLIGLTLALPLGAAAGKTGGANPSARASLLRGLCSGLGLALALTAWGEYFGIALSWFGAAALLGAGLASLSRNGAAASVACLLWLTLCALPFFYDKLAMTPLGGASEVGASRLSPWLGFAQTALATDPLRRTLLYFGHWTELSGAPAQGFLSATQLWCLAVFAMVAGLARNAFKKPAA